MDDTEYSAAGRRPRQADGHRGDGDESAGDDALRAEGVVTAHEAEQNQLLRALPQ